MKPLLIQDYHPKSFTIVASIPHVVGVVWELFLHTAINNERCTFAGKNLYLAKLDGIYCLVKPKKTWKPKCY